MPRFFFHLYECGTLIADDEGSECASLDVAHDRAIQAARSIMSSEVMAGRLCVGCRVDVADDAGKTVLAVPFKEALHISGM